MSDNYEDIIDLPRFISKNRNHMTNHDRAAQFAPFAALTGYDESIKEAARLVDDQIELSESELRDLDMKFNVIESNIKDRPEVMITYFVKDENKNGGAYFSKAVTIRRIDLNERIIITTDKEKYRLDDIYDIQSDLFKNIYYYSGKSPSSIYDQRIIIIMHTT